MRQLFSKADLRALSSILAVVILLGSAPLTAGIVIRSGSSQPEITANICHPSQTFDTVSSTLLARPATTTHGSTLLDLGAITANVAVQLIDYRVAPDTPPPKFST